MWKLSSKPLADSGNQESPQSPWSWMTVWCLSIFCSSPWGNRPFHPLQPLHSPYGNLAFTGTLTLKERALEFDTADIPQHHNSWSKFHQAKWFQELFSKFDADPWRLSPFSSPREDYFLCSMIASDLASVKLDQRNPSYSHLVTECCGLHLTQNNEISLINLKCWKKQKMPRGTNGKSEQSLILWYLAFKKNETRKQKRITLLTICVMGHIIKLWFMRLFTVYLESIHTLIVCTFRSYHFFQQRYIMCGLCSCHQSYPLCFYLTTTG